MKKTLIALAAVAATSAAFAQNVTLSGQIDTGFEKRFSGDPFRMTSNRNGTSNWTLSGTEDLGGGLKAEFRISTSFNSDNGTLGAISAGQTGTALGNNGMFVGVNGDFGRVLLGRPVHLLWGNVLAANGTKGVTAHDSATVLGGFALRTPSSGNDATVVLGTAKTGGAANAVYVDNAIQYFSPTFGGGFQVQVEYAPKEAPTGKDGQGLAIRYANGPLVASFTNYRGATSNVNQKSVNQLAAAYDFGVARVLFTWRDQGGAASDADNSYALGVTAPVGNGSLYASYNVNEQPGKDGRTLIAGYKYNLSKRTLVYVNVANRNAAWLGGQVVGTTAAGNTVPTGSSTGYGFGLQHSF